MTTEDIIKKIDGKTNVILNSRKEKLIKQAYDLGFKDGYETMSLIAMGEISSKKIIRDMLEDNNTYILNKITNNPKHVIINGALYEKIDDSVKECNLRD